MNDRRFLATWVGDGGCEDGPVGEKEDGGNEGGCSTVVVKGESSSADEAVEKYADVGVTIEGAILGDWVGLVLVFTAGLGAAAVVGVATDC